MQLELLSKEELVEIVKKLMKRVDELERRLRRYENPHMPSSKQIIKVAKEEFNSKKGFPLFSG